MAVFGRMAGVAITTALLAGCAVGPDYLRPSAPAPAAFKEQAGGAAASLDLWRTGDPQDASDRGAWWRVYGDPVLDGLERQVSISNQTLKASEAAFRQAQAVAEEARASFFPTLSLDASGQRAKTASSRTSSKSVTGSIGNAFSSSLSASWELDLWGSIRRTVESDEATAEATAADLASARLSAQASLATDYFELRSEDALARLLTATVAAYTQALQITRNQYAAGTAARADVVQAETQLASTRAQLVAVGIQRAQLEHAIAVLIGKPPAEFAIAADETFPTAPMIPAGLPSVLLERRPDIAAAERRVAAANAEIGIAVAAYYPTVTLTGSSGFSASSLGNLLQASNNVWSVGPQLAMTLFDAGARGAKVDAARAVFDQTTANYRQIVLTGFQQVEDELAASRILVQQAEVQAQAVASAEEAERLVFNQYRAGTVAYTNVVTAQATALSNKQTALTIAQNRLTASVSLIQALGGGWEYSQLSSPPVAAASAIDKP
ncbi:MAG TPA: efflux transporter outer membrane subunit [Telmatospirillum sp.]|nr:efflux transporter outer membrane subunit [Telmatospirillum sp.]